MLGVALSAWTFGIDPPEWWSTSTSEGFDGMHMVASFAGAVNRRWMLMVVAVATAVGVAWAPVLPAAAAPDDHVARELVVLVQDTVKAALGGAAAASLGEPIKHASACLRGHAQSGSSDGGSVAALECFGAFSSTVDPLSGFRIIDALPLARLVATLVAALVPHDPSVPHGPQPQPGAPGAAVPGSGGAVAPTAGSITSTFGDGRGHQGIDIGNDLGAPIVAVADGEIITAGPAQGFGLWMRIRHDDGTITTYGHNDENLLEQGTRVRMGQIVATVGNRGVSTGPHLHFEVLDPAGVNVDPAQWLAERGVVLAVDAEAERPAPGGPVVPQWVRQPRT